jgi:hypothetical protein
VIPVVLALVAVVVLGWPLAFALTGRLMLGTVLAPLVAGLLATVSAVLMILVGGRLVYWLVPIGLASFALAWWVHRRRLLDAAPHAGPVDIAFMTLPLLPPALDVLQPPVIWDSHAIWWTHGAALTQDAGYVRYMLGADAFELTHTDYPPLLSASVATGWTAGGTSFYASQFVSTLLTLSAIAMLIYAVRTVTAGGPVWASRCAAAATGLTAWAGSPMLVAAGYADHLWAATAVAGVVLLVMRPGGSPVLPVVLLSVAALTKNEGFICELIIAAVVTVRVWWRSRAAGAADGGGSGAGGGSGGSGGAGAAGGWRDRRWMRAAAPVWVAALAGLVWSLVSRAFGAQSDLVAGGGFGKVLSFDATIRDRLDQTLRAMWPAGGRLVAIAVVVAVAGALLLRPYRRRAGIEPDLSLWAVLVLYTGALTVTYLATPHDITWHLTTSIERTLVAVILLAAVSAAAWAVTAVGAALSPELEAPPEDRDEPAPSAPVRVVRPRQPLDAETGVPASHE